MSASKNDFFFFILKFDDVSLTDFELVCIVEDEWFKSLKKKKKEGAEKKKIK